MSEATYSDEYVYKYSLGLRAAWLNPVDIVIFKLLFLSMFISAILFIIIADHPAPILPFFVLVLIINWRTIGKGFRYRIRSNQRIDLAVMENLVCLEQGERFYSMPKRFSRVQKGLFNTNVIRTPMGQYFLVNSEVVPLDELKRVIGR